MLLRAQLADDRAEDTGADRLLVVVDEDGRVRIEADRRAVGTMDVLGGADDDRLVDVALLDAAAGCRFLDGHDDDVADARETALRPAQHLDALDALRAAIVRDVEIGLHLDHRSNSFFTSASEPSCQRRLASMLTGQGASLRRVTPICYATSAFSGVACVSTRSSTFQVFSFEIGRVSSMRTVSPALNSLPSSWAWYFFDLLMILPY